MVAVVFPGADVLDNPFAAAATSNARVASRFLFSVSTCFSTWSMRTTNRPSCLATSFCTFTENCSAERRATAATSATTFSASRRRSSPAFNRSRTNFSAASGAIGVTESSNFFNEFLDIWFFAMSSRYPCHDRPIPSVPIGSPTQNDPRHGRQIGDVHPRRRPLEPRRIIGDVQV